MSLREWDCRDCGSERLFEQPHELVGSCPDTPDGVCPEWLCTECGAALLASLPVIVRAPLPAAVAKVA